MTRTAGSQPFVPSGIAEPVTTKGRVRRVREAVDERLGIDAIRYPVPAHANKVSYSLGGLTAFSLLILIVTGIVLAQYYNPDPASANESVRHIVNGVYLGRFVRGLHFWASEAMYVLAILHLLRVYFTASYKRPREANWLIGVGMFSLIIGAMFTGTVLKWDQEGFEALGHNLELSRLLGGIGFWFTSGFSSHVSLLIRLYVAHVSIIPMLILGLLVLHTLLIKRHKISPAPANPDATGEPVGPFTHHLRRIGALAPWMYWWMFTLENWIGLAGILWGVGVLFGLLVAVPFLDRNPHRYWRQRPVALTLAALVLAFLIVLTILEAITTPAQHLM